MIHFPAKKLIRHKTEMGMSLSELLVSLAIMMIIMIAIYSFNTNVFIYTNQSRTQINNTWQAEAVLKPMTQELRSMVPSASGSYAIQSVSTSSITFFANINKDNSIEQVRYFYASTTLYRGVISPTGNPPVYNSASENIRILADGVRASSTLPIFQYYDSYYEGTSSALTFPINISSIRLIRINVIIDTDVNRSPIRRIFSSVVSLRGLKTNL